MMCERVGIAPGSTSRIRRRMCARSLLVAQVCPKGDVRVLGVVNVLGGVRLFLWDIEQVVLEFLLELDWMCPMSCSCLNRKCSMS